VLLIDLADLMHQRMLSDADAVAGQNLRDLLSLAEDVGLNDRRAA
jgi:hypothetical protein